MIFWRGLDSILLIMAQLRSLLHFGVSLGRCPEHTKEELWGGFFCFLLFFCSYKFDKFQIYACGVCRVFYLIKEG